jgi:proteasome accessory factor B
MRRHDKPDNHPESPHARPPLERMLRIHRALQGQEFPTLGTLAGDLEVSTKSIQRDLDFMRDRMLLPIEFDRTHGGFRYTEEVNAFPTMQITEGEILALVVAEKALQQYRGTSFEKPLLSAIRKMAEGLPDTISLDLAQVDRTISFRTRAQPVLDLEIFETLTRATAGRRQIEIAYRKPGQHEADTRLVDPYHLANINGEWYLFAFDHLRKDLRTFVPSRIQSARETGKLFKPTQPFSLEERLRGSFGVRSGEGLFDVVLRFSPRVADYIREKKWHPSQKVRELRQGGVELSLRLSSLQEVERWVLSWGGNASVVRPRELKDAVRKAARRILEASGKQAQTQREKGKMPSAS